MAGDSYMTSLKECWYVVICTATGSPKLHCESDGVEQDELTTIMPC